MLFMKFPATLVQVAENSPPPPPNWGNFFSCQKMPLQRKTIKINDYSVLTCWDPGPT